MEALINVAKATGRVASSILRGVRIRVTPQEFHERTAICVARAGECYDPKYGRCMQCHCIVSLKARAATEECPRKLWPLLKTKL